MNKDRHIIAELNSIFAESDNTKAIQGIMNVMSHITLDHRQIDFAIKNGLNFAGSVSGQMFACKKDMFYRFLSNEDINWRPKSLAKLKLN